MQLLVVMVVFQVISGQANQICAPGLNAARAAEELLPSLTGAGDSVSHYNHIPLPLH